MGHTVEYIPTVLFFLLPFLILYSPGLFKSFAKNPASSVRSPPVYGPWYLPRFIRGVEAMVRLGADEDGFLHSVRQRYGPVVYLPWPLGQVFVLDGEIMRTVYSLPATTLTFVPVRLSFQANSFGTPQSIIRNQIFERRIYPIHGKGMANVRLDAPVQRFIQVVERKVTELGEKVDDAGGTLEMGLVRWVVDAMFEAAASALFGEEFRIQALDGDLQEPFNIFDACFPLLASEMVPSFLSGFIPPIAKGLKGRDRLIEALAVWVENGMPGLEEGVERDVAEIGLSEGCSLTEIATFLLTDLWALQANTPFAASSLLLYALQSPILPVIYEEIDSLPTKSGSSTPSLSIKTLTSMPLMMSCIQETLRLTTSTCSIRVVEKSFILPTSEKDADGQGFLVPCGSRLVCATRAAHLSDQIWGKDPSAWDGDRFQDKTGAESELKNQMAKEMRGFGGGVSICEGRHLAVFQLKSLVALTLAAFTITPLYPTSTDGKTPLPPSLQTPLNIKGSIRNGIAPGRAAGRTGMGAFQFDGADVIVKVARRASVNQIAHE